MLVKSVTTHCYPQDEVMEDLRASFRNSHVLRNHVEFLYEKGGIYRVYNGNLLFHGCIPLDEKGNLDGIQIGEKFYCGKEYMDYAQRVARLAFYQGTRPALDFMWYLWCGKKAPLSGRNIKTFERTFVDCIRPCPISLTDIRRLRFQMENPL